MADKNYATEVAEYTHVLLHSPAGAPGRVYLQRRGLTPTTARAWGLGYCPVDFTPKCYAARAGRVPPKARFWEKMRGRLTIPVVDSAGDIVAISGRAVDATVPGPKYMHYVFPTSRVLFGLWMNRRTAFDTGVIVLTEGQLDVISAWQAGMRCVCACFGAHFSEHQLALATRYVDKVGILFDDDEAGRQGAQTAIAKCKTTGGARVRVLTGVLGGHDLDEFIRAGGDWHELIAAAQHDERPDADELLRRRLANA